MFNLFTQEFKLLKHSGMWNAYKWSSITFITCYSRKAWHLLCRSKGKGISLVSALFRIQFWFHRVFGKYDYNRYPTLGVGAVSYEKIWIHSRFAQTYKIGNNGIWGFTVCKQKRNKMWPQWALNLRPNPFRCICSPSLS